MESVMPSSVGNGTCEKTSICTCLRFRSIDTPTAERYIGHLWSGLGGGNNVGPAMAFYSRNGKKTLAKIWKDQSLDKDLVLSSWIGGGPSKGVITEKVSEYMQNFLQNKNKRIMLMNHKLMLRYLPLRNSEDYSDTMYPVWSKHQQIYEFHKVAGAQQLVLNELLGQRARERELNERQRIQKLILERKLDAPKGFRNILLNLSLMEDRLKSLENALLRAEHASGSRFVPKVVPLKEEKRKVRKPKSPPDPRVSPEHRTSSSSNVPSHSKADSTSVLSSLPPSIILTEPDGPHKPPSTEYQIQSKIRHGLLCTDESTFSSSVWTYIEDMDDNYDLNLDDMSIFAASATNRRYRASEELDYDHFCTFPESLVADLPTESQQIFSKAQDMIGISSLKLSEARWKILKVNRAHFDKMFTAFSPF